MKRYIYRFMFILSTLVSAASCAEKMSDAEDLAGRDRTAIEVSYAVAGTEVNSVPVASAAVKKTLEVTVNNDNLKWNLESNRDWCAVVPEEHRGSGTVTLSIAANEGFEAREPATLTFVAGNYRGFEITINQNATAFIIGQPYFVSGKAGGTYNVNVTTPAGTEWEFTSEDWMEVTEGTSTSSDELTTTVLTIKADVNDGVSRYGTIALSAGEETGNISVYQFGTDLEYAEDGSILLEGTAGASLTLTAPAYIINSVQTPKFATATLTENEDGTSTVSVSLKENLNDCSQSRNVELSLQLSNASASVVTLPAVVQDYIPANGLVTAQGVMTFAKAVAEGTPTTDWEDNGVVTVKGDIDMSDVTGWTGIGTADSPFKGQFNGGGYEFTNLKKTSAGLFAYCEGANIKNVILGEGCSLYFDKKYTGMEGVFGGIVTVAEETTVAECQFNGAMDFAGSNDNGEPAYIGGVVGYADENSVVTNSRMGGTLVVSTGPAQMLCYVGGIIGWSEGTVSNNVMTGELKFLSGISDLIAGGVISALPAKTKVSANSFMGSITLGGNSSNVILGGLYGSVQSDRSFDIASDKSVTLGNIAIDSYKTDLNTAHSAGTEIFAGGFVGKAAADVELAFNGYECQTNISLDQTTGNKALCVCLGGVLGGCDFDAAAKSVKFGNVSNNGVFSTKYDGDVTSPIDKCFVGGLAGFVNGPTSFKNCINNGVIGKVLSGANPKSDSKRKFVFAGIAGVVIGGDAEFVSCENKGIIFNKQYCNSAVNNNDYDSANGWYSVCTAAGVLGAFDYKETSVSGKLTMKDCINSGDLNAYRGIGAGIVGFARNAEIMSCTNNGSLAQHSASNSPHKGGISGWLMKSEIKKCIAKCDIYAPTSSTNSPKAGGILSIAKGGEVKITDCSYYGEIIVSKTETSLSGGVIAASEDDTVLTDCKFGGKVNDITVSENNVESLATGNGLGEVSGITLWSGTL